MEGFAISSFPNRLPRQSNKSAGDGKFFIPVISPQSKFSKGQNWHRYQNKC